MITLFIDTNVLLSFYHLTSEDIEELKKLVALVKNKEISLIVPKQVGDEFWRNRGAKISDAMKKLREAKFNASFPAFSKDYSEYEELRGTLKKADKLHAELVGKMKEDAENMSLKADEVVTGLFKVATKPEFDDEHYLNALRRVRLGNPPGKNESLGDAMNWETLLATIAKGTDLYLVSEDKDYRSQLSDGAFNEFLRDEWETEKKSSINYYSKISDFFKDRFPDIKIASQVESDLAINSLSNSGSFASTHSYIGKLDAFEQFTIAQVERLIKIPGQNNQVGWIIDDTDVHQFYAKLLAKYGGGLKNDDLELLKELVAKGEPQPDEEVDPLS
ncbi:PIN domain-containing protein [Bradyrhizobium sp. CCBAU 53340]|uniref:PIN domain-containing protein n=1 Tax=Bradyrhizobium sp. CCBAU 53340 TaxID=1325112 RepID=UPI001FEDE83A|nr:PIN domain-containing protein [Bradyrhizobium sp. CCBAU 53340]